MKNIVNYRYKLLTSQHQIFIKSAFNTLIINKLSTKNSCRQKARGFS
uniref:Uncharacterized protein n=1 Tax=Meloidogyne enterolobii TaxID=390850 RepID=A0A6V7VG65_MELEN|nr:unnamed protein product [Meloidogyne enterolobii]CAD2193519.1 unnamed protein product [Meloidogyne enterolobii]